MRTAFALALLLAMPVVAGCGGAGTTSSAAATMDAPGASASTQSSPSPASDTPAPTPAPASPSPSIAAGLLLVALGDSGTTGSGDPRGRGWAGYYADAIAEATGQPVELRNLARNGTTSAAMLAAIRTEGPLAAAIEAADIVALGIGGADLNAGDAALEAGDCEWEACFRPVVDAFAANITALASEIRTRNPNVVLRGVGLPNGLAGAEPQLPTFIAPIATELGAFQGRAMTKAVCDAMGASGGACADVVSAFNGDDATADAYATGLMNIQDCCYPSEEGHRLIARLLMEAGLDPLAGR